MTPRLLLCAILVVAQASPLAVLAAPPAAARAEKKPEPRKEAPGAARDAARKDDTRKDEKAPEAKPDEPLALYEPAMLRLAETLGALAFLRDLCGAGDGAQWRERMQALLESEGAAESRRARLAGAFNRGFQDYAMVYRFCTPAAELALTRRLAEGRKLTRDLAARWGG
jgi:uncharacterized protein (TIGR02301 family)